MINYNRLGYEIKGDLSVRPMRICAVWNPFPKTSRQRVCVPLTVALTPMTTTVIFLNMGNVLLYVPKRTGMSFTMGRPATSLSTLNSGCRSVCPLTQL